MRRRLVHLGAWLSATSCAVTVSWFGVHRVLSETVYDFPRTLPVIDEESTPPPSPKPQASSTHRPKPPPPPTVSRSSPPARPSSTRPSSTPPKTSSPPPSQSTTPTKQPERGTIRSVATTGGRAVFEVRDNEADLVSATPNAGYDVTVWESPNGIQVSFSDASNTSSVHCTWGNGAPPQIYRVER
ncbi:hypothetical protein [Streptomyces sp. NPDC005438]|uniref:hypothetical protein n=1 Tax=Streptomyces sp. NPDC005438 TaxID=3156880 RepID=UPI0033A873F1